MQQSVQDGRKCSCVKTSSLNASELPVCLHLRRYRPILPDTRQMSGTGGRCGSGWTRPDARPQAGKTLPR